MKLIINADDLGYSPIVNRTIIDLHHHQRISSASLLVNMPHSQDAFDRFDDCPDLDVGVHLNLTKGRPLSPPGKIPSLITHSGAFYPTKRFYIRAVTGQINFAEVKLELRAQIGHALAYGIQPAHLDTHAHWHMLPHLSSILTELAKEHQIPGIRQAQLSRTLIPSSLWLAGVERKYRSKSDLSITDYLLSLHQWMGSNGKPKDLFFSTRLLQWIARQRTTLEMVVHPGALDDPDFPTDTLGDQQRQWEYDFLLSPFFDMWLDQAGAEISSYKAL